MSCPLKIGVEISNLGILKIIANANLGFGISIFSNKVTTYRRMMFSIYLEGPE
jgi:hypothetical protein